MKELLSKEKGITIITVTTMVIVILVIIAVFTFYARNSVKMESFEGMKADIKEIEAKALLYNIETKALPITSVDDTINGFEFGDYEFRNPNDSNTYYKVDVNKLGITKAYNTDYYINDSTLTVYAKDPILLNSKNYGRFKEEFDKFKIPQETVLPDWALEAPSEMYTFDDMNWITGVNEDFCRQHHGDPQYAKYFNDYKNWINIVIPAYRANGDPIVGIRSSAFINTNINNGSIMIPSTIKIMEKNIFNGASNVNYVYCDAIIVDLEAFNGGGFNNFKELTVGPNCQMPDGNPSYGVFSKANNLKKITIECSSIGKYAFVGAAQSCTDIYLLGSPTKIPEGAFMNCAYNSDVNIHIDANSTAHEVVFPDTITTFEKNCFYNSGIWKLPLPDNVTEIQEGAFRYEGGGNRLREIDFNDNLVTIGNYAFYENRPLTSLYYNGRTATFNTNLQSIGEHAFENCINGFPRSVNISRNTNVAANAFPSNVTINRY